jgi:hypothetical protein
MLISINLNIRKTVSLVLIIFNATAALFMTDKAWCTSQLNIDLLLLMSGSHREFDVWVQWAAAIGQHLVKLKEIILLICTFVQWLQSNTFICTKFLNSAVGAKDIKNTQIPCDLHTVKNYKEVPVDCVGKFWFLFLPRDGPSYWADFILFT